MDDAELIRRLEDLSLPFDQWTHRAHVRVAFCHLSRFSFAEALTLVRYAIKAYNAANHLPEGPTSGYNETTTVAFLKIIDATMRACGRTFRTPDSETFCDTYPHLMHREVLRLFYSPGRRLHPDAKANFIEPDMTAFPTVDRLPCE